MRVERWDPKSDGRLTEEALRGKIEALGYEATVYEYPPGTCFPTHSHAVDKLDAVLSGSFRLTMEGRVVVLGPGDLLFVPRGTAHSAEVIGERTVVSLDGVKAR